MPVRKYRHVGEMDREIWYERDDPRRFEAMRGVWHLAQKLARPSFPPGVYRFRSVEEAAAQRKKWECRNVEALRSRRRQPS